MDIFMQDIRHSWRSLVKAPLFTITAVFCLVLSIGAVSSIFSLFNAVVLDAYPFEEPDGLVDIQLMSRTFDYDNPNDFTYTMPLRALNYVLDSQPEGKFAWKADRGFAITEREIPVQIGGSVVSADFFDFVRPQMLLGRAFTLEDKDQPVAMISFRSWVNDFGKADDILGKSVTIDGTRHTMVGVLQKDHRYPAYADMWIPEKSNLMTGDRMRGRMSFNIIGRLQQNQTIEQFNAELLSLSDQTKEIDGGLFNRYRYMGITVPRLLARGSQLGTTLQLLLGAVMALLLIASANVANLMLSRMQQQQQELSLRAALGARRSRLVRRLLLESGILAAISALLGVALAYFLLPLFVQQAGGLIQNPERVQIDANVLLFSLFITLSTTFVVSLVPLWKVLTADLASTLRAGGNKGMMGGNQKIRQVLVITEAALAFALLVGAGLMLKSFKQIQSVNLGYDHDNLQTIVVHAPASRAAGHFQAMAFYRQAAESIATVPGVISAAYSNAMPINDRNASYSMSIEDFPPDNPEDLIEPPPIGEMSSANYLETMGIEIVEGRLFTSQDRPDSLQTVVISENMANYHWPNESAIGKRIKRGAYNDENFPWWTIIGVVNEVRSTPMALPPHRFYRSTDQHELSRTFNDMRMVIRTQGDPSTLLPAIRMAVRNVAEDAVVANELTMAERVANGTRTQQVAMTVVLSLGVIGLILAVVGIFGVFSYNVQQRFREIGLRMVLGARSDSILLLVLRSALGLGLVGLAIGLALTLSAKDYIETYLYQVSGIDPMVYLQVIGILLLAMFAAAWIPAKRATKTDPVNTLRQN